MVTFLFNVLYVTVIMYGEILTMTDMKHGMQQTHLSHDQHSHKSQVNAATEAVVTYFYVHYTSETSYHLLVLLLCPLHSLLLLENITSEEVEEQQPPKTYTYSIHVASTYTLKNCP